jgi:DNA-binding NarL/FixJ family response regulator
LCRTLFLSFGIHRFVAMSIKVAIVEDDTRVRESLAVLIDGSGSFSCVGAFHNAETALKKIPGNWPDVVLMDVNLPKMSGIDCVAKLKTMRPALLMVMLTSYEDNEMIFDSLMAGASGYLTKRTPPAAIIEAIADVHRGGSPITSSIARQIVRYFHTKQPVPEMPELSKREMEILELLSQGQKNKEIAATLSISIETVRIHVRHIYEKLQVHSRTEAVVKFLEKGKGV